MIRETKSFHLRSISPRINIKRIKISQKIIVINCGIAKENVNPVF